MPYDKYDIIINGAAGTAKDIGKEGVIPFFQRIFGQKLGQVIHVAHDYMDDAIDQWYAENADSEKGLLVAGGDGTIKHALPKFIEHDRPLGIVPMGTFNVLANDLGFSQDLETCAKQYETAKVREIDYGTMNGSAFTCSASIGETSKKLIDLREAWRNKDKMMETLWSTMTHALFSKPENLRVTIDGKTTMVAAHLLALSVNEFMPVKDAEKDPRAYTGRKKIGNAMIKPADALDNGELVLYAYNMGDSWWDRLLSFRNLNKVGMAGNDDVQVLRGSEIKIESADGTPLFVSVDGEAEGYKETLDFKNHQRGLKVLAPSGP